MIKKTFPTPFQKFFEIESLSAVLLFGATVIALVWANSPWGEVYARIWESKVGISVPGLELNKSLILWVNDGLMAVFFFTIGLEIKRELLIGELNSARKVVLPFFAAIGGMLIPVGMFFVLNQDSATIDGWGIPMATDIAFSLAILKLLGDRVPIGIKVFLTALAIVDDIGAVFTIAVFYSNSISWGLLGVAAVLLAILFYASSRGMYSKYIFFAVAVVVWILFLKAGIHPTVAGILMALTIPIRQRVSSQTYIDRIIAIAEELKSARVTEHPVLTHEQIAHLDDLEDWTDQFQSPVQHLEHRLHGWVAYVVIPVFAFANAGIIFDFSAGIDTHLALIIAACLVLGKGIGVPLLTWLSLKLKFAEMPEGVTMSQIIGVGFLAGIGFTMSIFIATLAYPNQPGIVNSAKIGILAGSVIAAVLGYFIIRFGVVKNQ